VVPGVLFPCAAVRAGAIRFTGRRLVAFRHD
jgi:hypothetical protein